MPNAWINHVKQFALENGISYGCALSMPECKSSYKKPMKEMKSFSKNQKLEDYMKELKQKKPKIMKPVKLGKQVKLSLDEDLPIEDDKEDVLKEMVKDMKNIKLRKQSNKPLIFENKQAEDKSYLDKKFQDFVKRAKAKKNKFITPRLINYKLEESDYIEPEQPSWKPFSLKLDMKLKGKKLEKADEELLEKINNLPDDIRRTVKTEYFNINDMNAKIKKAEEEIKGAKKEKESTRLRITKKLEEYIKDYEREITNSKNILRNMGFEI